MESLTHPMTEWLCNIAAIYHQVNFAPSPMVFESFLILHNKQPNILKEKMRFKLVSKFKHKWFKFLFDPLVGW